MGRPTWRSFDKAAVEVGKAKEDLDFADAGWGSPRGDDGDFCRIHGYAFRRDDISEKLNLVDTELTLLEINLKLGVRKELQDSAYIGGVSFFVLRVDQDVIQINDYDRVQTLAQDVVEERLKRGRRVTETEGHNQELEMAITRPKRRFPFVSFGNSDEVVRTLQVQLGKDFGRAQTV